MNKVQDALIYQRRSVITRVVWRSVWREVVVRCGGLCGGGEGRPSPRPVPLLHHTQLTPYHKRINMKKLLNSLFIDLPKN